MPCPHEPPPPIEALLTALQEHPLEPWSTQGPLANAPDTFFFCGEFQNIPYPFNILSTDPAVVRQLTEAFQANTERFNVQLSQRRHRRLIPSPPPPGPLPRKR